MDQETRNKLRNVVTQCRKLLEDSVSQELEGKYGIFAKKDQVTADPNAEMTHLTEEEQAARKDILDHFGHISEFDIATPWTFAVFRSKGGGRAYFHGGLSPQELIVPVVVMHSAVKPSAASTGVQWTL